MTFLILLQLDSSWMTDDEYDADVVVNSQILHASHHDKEKRGCVFPSSYELLKTSQEVSRNHFMNKSE